MNLIRKLLLKSNRVKQAVFMYQIQKRKQAHWERWAKLMRSGVIR